MTTSALSRLRNAKQNADSVADDRDNYALYVAERVECGGWAPEDVNEYRAAVGVVMHSGTEDARLAAREFWALKAKDSSFCATGINDRIKAFIAAEKRLAA